jgi:hypothetical protein
VCQSESHFHIDKSPGTVSPRFWNPLKLVYVDLDTTGGTAFNIGTSTFTCPVEGYYVVAIRVQGIGNICVGFSVPRTQGRVAESCTNKRDSLFVRTVVLCKAGEQIKPMIQIKQSTPSRQKNLAPTEALTEFFVILIGKVVTDENIDPGLAGPQGPPGLQGSQGPKGRPGEMGMQGPRGPAGPQGDKGDKGCKGDKGDRGEKGMDGPQGDKGKKGDTGPKGATGDQGPKGPDGPQGAKGDKGPIGPPGTGTVYRFLSWRTTMLVTLCFQNELWNNLHCC